MALSSWGWSMHIYDIPVDRLQYTRLAAWLFELFFLLGNACTKISILLLYPNISTRSHIMWFIRLTWVAITFTFLYAVALVLELMLVCRPFMSYWESYSPAYTESHTCADEQVPVVLSAVASVVSDFYASVLTMLLIRQLKLTPRQRVGLYAVFSAGIFTRGIGIGRVIYLVKVTTKYQLGLDTHDVTWYGWPLFVSDISGNLHHTLTI
jgi:hypothetical protein